MCEIHRFTVAERAMATRSGAFIREGRRWKWGKPDIEGKRGTESAVVLVCFGEEGAPGRVATMAGWTERATVSSRVRSQGRMESRDRRYDE